MKAKKKCGIEITACPSSFIYLVKIDSANYKSSHLLKVESVRRVEGKDIFVIPPEYSLCAVAANESEGLQYLKAHYKTLLNSATRGIVAERMKLIEALDACTGADIFSVKRHAVLEKEIVQLGKSEVDLILMTGHTFSVESYSARYATGHSINDIKPD